MTDERKNEIWAMLPSGFKTEIAIRYVGLSDELKRPITTSETHRISGRILMLEELFGSHNLTAQAEEKPNAESIKSEDGRILIPIKAEYDDSVYADYRLDLAKEIAVTMVGNLKIATITSCSHIAEDTVRLANEIVKRLKETEE